MSYYLNKILDKNISFKTAKERVIEQLKQEGFGVLTNIDIKATFKKKLNKDVNQYEILGACNPDYAYNVLQTESKLGVFLPCNVIIEELDNGQIEVSAVDPIASMSAVENKNLEHSADEVRQKLQNVINRL